MNDLNKLEVQQIRKRIEIKRSNLKILLPEVNFLQFIDKLEQFQQIIEGVDTDGPVPQVQLSLVRLHFESLQNQYNTLIRLLADGVKRAAAHSNDILLKELLQVIQESTIFLLTSFHNFHSRIAKSTDLLYNINAIIVVRDLLLDLKDEVNIVRKNFYNLEKSTAKDQARNILNSIYLGALASCCFKFEEFSQTFPKFRKVTFQQQAYKINRLKMIEEVQDVSKDMPEKVAINSDEMNVEPAVDPDIDENAEAKVPAIVGEEKENLMGEQTKDPSTKEATDIIEDKLYSSEAVINYEGKEANPDEHSPDIAEDKNDQEEKTDNASNHLKGKEKSEEKLEGNAQIEAEGEKAHDAPSSPKTSSTLPIPPTKLSVGHLKIEFQSKIYQQRSRFESGINELIYYETNVRENYNLIEQTRRIYELDLEQLEKQKQTIAENDELTDDEIMKKIRDITLQMDRLTGSYQKRIKNLETEIVDWKKQLFSISGHMQEGLKELREMKKHAFNSIKSSYIPATDDAPSPEQILEEFNNIYSELAGILSKLELVENFELDNRGVYYFDETNTKVYVTKVAEDLLETDLSKITISKALSFRDDETSSALQDQSGTLISQSRSTKTASESTPDSVYRSSLDDTQEVHETIPEDSESYIKTQLGHPLRQALAAITINQPSDPINYLANYLLQYRYNELRNPQEQQYFENVIKQRKQYAKKLQLKNMRHKMKEQQCDPYNRTTSQNSQ